ncbi:response regulator [Chitinimonas arctica]|uniref:Response regulator n=1 Tax=Chitinimonas arctica TaxID=2594795 RepID=A0A516SB63_9NEIS|nr:response regulator [Chitinimonas arctica]QDQ25386.1 response regulator [Chitinimonas arctica]
MQAQQPTHILLVEDDPHDAELSMELLRESNFANALTWVKDGLEALDFIYCREAFAQRTPELPGLILLDLNMPRVDGTEVLAILKADERTKHIPVVVMTTSDLECDILMARELGATCYVIKPVDLLAMSKVVNNTGLNWILVDQRSTQ